MPSKAWWKRLLEDFVRWTVVAGLADSKLSYAAALIPVAGYALLWSGQPFPLFAYDLLPGSGFLSLTLRLRLIYGSGVLVLVGLTIYKVAAPKQIKANSTLGEYARLVRDTADVDEIETAGRLVQHNEESAPLRGWHGAVLPADTWKIAARMFGEVGHQHVPALVHARNLDNFAMIVPVLSAHYEQLDRSRHGWCLLALSALVLGAGCAMLPSIEVAWLVLKSFFG